jgi:APA family basic amino acid/polyamine antiporter
MPDPGPLNVKLPRVLGPTEALSIIVGSTIGSGIFIVAARVANNVPSVGGIALAWVIGGLFSLAGALTLAELSAMFPSAGGPYLYLRAAYGTLPAFLFVWTEFLIIRAGSVATLAAACALYATQLLPAPEGIDVRLWQTCFAVGAMVLVAVINVIGTRVGGQVQVAGTILKVGALGAMIVAPFLMGEAHLSNWSTIGRAGADVKVSVEGFMAAMISILWAYDGWVNGAALAEEIRDPGRNIPRALMLGMAILIGLYLTMTLVYHLVLPLDVVQSAETERGSPKVVAALFCQKLFGTPGLVAISTTVMLSTLISLNGNSMSGPRAYFAMARDGLFPAWLCRVHPRFQTPANAIIAQNGWAILLTLAGTAWVMLKPESPGGEPPKPLYDILYSYVIFGGTVFYTLSIASVFVLRRTQPDRERPYRTWGFPITPSLYVMASLFLIFNMLAGEHSRMESLVGLGIILLGVPLYLVYWSKGAHRGGSDEPLATSH